MDRITQQWKGLESTLSDKKTLYNDRVTALVSGWEQLALIIAAQSSPEAYESIFEFLHKESLQLILHYDWPKQPQSVKVHLKTVLQHCVSLLSKIDPELTSRCRILTGLVLDPWDHPTLKKILQNTATEEEEVYQFFESEGSQLLVMRLDVLCKGKCEDFALRLAEACFKYLQQSAMIPQPNHINYVRDVLIALLFRFKRNHDIIAQLKQLDLEEGLHLVQRYAKKNTSGARIWKHCDKVTEIAAHTILASAMVQCVDEPTKQQLLYDLIKEWALIHVPKLFNSHNTIHNMVRKMIQTAESSNHIYVFSNVLKNEFGNDMKSLCIELYIRGLTTNMNEVEQQKMKNDRKKIHDAEKRLSEGFLQLADILQGNLSVCRECVLTAFSLNPTRSCLERIKALAIECGKCSPDKVTDFRLDMFESGFKPLQLVTSSGLSTTQTTVEKEKLNSNECQFHTKPGSGIGENELCPHCGQFVGKENSNSNNLSILDPESLGLAQHLCDDLSTVLSSPRYQMLSWSMDWEQLNSKCEKYLEEYDSRRNNPTELKFLNIDYTQFKNWPDNLNQDDMEDGVEKGYEDWLDYQDNSVDKNMCSYGDFRSDDEDAYSKELEMIWPKEKNSKRRKRNENDEVDEFLAKNFATGPYDMDFPKFKKLKKDACITGSKIMYKDALGKTSAFNIGDVDEAKLPKLDAIDKKGKDQAYSLKNVGNDKNLSQTLRTYKANDVSKDISNSAKNSEILRKQLLKNVDPKVTAKVNCNLKKTINDPYDFDFNEKCLADKDSSKMDILAQAVMRSDILLANSVPGLTSLEMLIPEAQEPTVQVVQLPNTIISQAESSSTDSSSSSTINHPRNKPLTDTATTQSSSSLSSGLNSTLNQGTDLQGIQTQPTQFGSEASQSLTGPFADATISGSIPSTSASAFASTSASALTSMLLNSMINRQQLTKQATGSTQAAPSQQGRGGTKIPVSSTQVLCGSNQVLAVSNQLMQTLLANQEGSTPISAHIQRIGHPIKKSDETQQTAKSTTSKPEEATRVNTQPQPVFRLIVKDGGRLIEHTYPGQEQGGVPEHQIHAFSSDQIIKLIKARREAGRKVETVAQVASLPKFHQVFGRQIYQNVGLDSNEGLSTQTQFALDAGKEGSSSAQSKGVQTTIKDNSGLKLEKGRSEAEVQATTAVSKMASSTESKAPQETRNVNELPSSQGVIFACKVPVSSANLLQGKPVAIVKANPQDGSSADSRNKETVIRSNMNALLAAALQSPSPLRPSTVTTVSNNSPVKVTSLTETKKSPDGSQKIRLPSPTTPKGATTTIRRSQPVISPQAIQRFVRPVVQVAGGTSSSSSSSPSSVPCIPIPLRTVPVLSATALAPGLSNTKGERRNEAITATPVEQNSVSSTTLEQLREFESVLEQVTNTSQMKERGSQAKSSSTTDHISVLPHTSPNSDFSSPSPKPNNLYPNTSGELASNERVSLTFISKSPSTPSSSIIPGTSQKLTATTPVVVVQSCNRPVASVASPTSLSLASQSSSSPLSATSTSSTQGKINTKINKPKSKSVGKTTPTTSTLKISTLPKPQQKPQEDEQTTQRIYAILDKYAEQLRNSPELKNKPAPRRRSNPPTSSAQSSKRKKSSQSKAKPSSSMSTCSSGIELSPGSEDLRTLGSEDSSNGVSQLSQVMNSPQGRIEELSTPTGGDASSEASESLDAKDHRPQHRILLTDATQGAGRTVIVQENLQPTMINVEGSKVLAGKQVVVGGSAAVPLTLSLPGTGNVKQVLFPVQADGRLVVAKVPKMYRVHQVTGSPLIATSSGGAVVLRQMCLNKSGTNVKQVKLPVVSSISPQSLSNMASSSQPTVVLPTTGQSFTLATSGNSEGDALGISLDNTILLNASSSSSIGFIQRNIKSVQQSTAFLSASGSRTSQSSDVATGDSASDLVSCLKSDIMTVCTPSVSVASSSVDDVSKQSTPEAKRMLGISYSLNEDKKSPTQNLPQHVTVPKNWSQILNDIKPEETIKDLDSKLQSSVSSKNDFSALKDCLNDGESSKHKSNSDSVIKQGPIGDENDFRSGQEKVSKGIIVQSSSDPWHYNVTTNTITKLKSESPSQAAGLHEIESKGNDTESSSQTLPIILSSQSVNQNYKRKINSVENTIFQIAFKKVDKVSKSNHVKEELINQRNASALERELRLQKSLSEECEDLGVDKPSTSDLFPEAELLLDPDPLSRDSLPGEIFSRGVESSSSSHGSPSRSPVLGIKSTIQAKTTKRNLVRAKSGSPRWESPRKPEDSPRSTTAVNGTPADSEERELEAEVFQHLRKHCSSQPDCNETDEENCDFSECDEDFLPSQRCLNQSPVNQVKSERQTNSSDKHVDDDSPISSSPKCLPPIMTYNKRANYKVPSKEKIKSEDDLSWFKVVKGVKESEESETEMIDLDNSEKTATTDESAVSDSSLVTSNGLQAMDEPSCQSETRKRKLSCSPKSQNSKGRKGKKSGAFMSSPGEDSGSSGEAQGDESEVCTGLHRLTRRSSTRGLVKKGCPCLNGSPEPGKKKKDGSGILMKITTPSSPSPSLPLSPISKRSPTPKSCVKSMNKKR